MLREGREITTAWLFLAATLNTPQLHVGPAILQSCWWQSKISALAAGSSLSIAQAWFKPFSSRCFTLCIPIPKLVWNFLSLLFLFFFESLLEFLAIGVALDDLGRAHLQMRSCRSALPPPDC